MNGQDFYRNDHRLIFEAVAGLIERGQPCDAVTLSGHLEGQGVLEQIGGLAYLGSLARDTPTAANIRAYADIVRERSVLRQLITAGNLIAGSALEPEGREAREIVDDAERAVFEIDCKGVPALLHPGTGGGDGLADHGPEIDVHPPLYFWVLDAWRYAAGPSWFAARLLSVLFTLAALWFLGRVAAAVDTPVFPTLFLALLSYGFAYTGVVARGFALAQMLDIAGVFLLLRSAQTRHWALALAGGAAFGAACFTNYLALFTAAATLFGLLLARPRRFAPA